MIRITSVINSKFSVGIIVIVLIALTSAEEFCLQCHSEEEPECLQPLTTGGWPCTDNITNTLGCFTRISEGFTLRGCLTSVEGLNCIGDSMCITCNTSTINNGCNNMPFPLNRRRCHMCRGGFNSTCATITSDFSPVVCPMFMPNDQCFTQVSDSLVERGCLSSRGDMCEAPGDCTLCNTDGCNNARASASIIKLSVGFILSLVAVSALIK